MSMSDVSLNVKVIAPAGVVGMKQNIGGMRDAVEQLKCVGAPVGCGKQITPEEIADWDPLTQKEYSQSGWCSDCQDLVFGACDDECGCDG